LLVVNKPKGMVVHPAAGNYSGTLVNALLYHCGDSLSGINGVMRPVSCTGLIRIPRGC
jgi:23S rRNA pseudouridine1911/1915/1917 synthase